MVGSIRSRDPSDSNRKPDWPRKVIVGILVNCFTITDYLVLVNKLVEFQKLYFLMLDSASRKQRSRKSGPLDLNICPTSMRIPGV